MFFKRVCKLLNLHSLFFIPKMGVRKALKTMGLHAGVFDLMRLGLF